MDKKLHRFCAGVLACAVLWMALWSVVDDTSLRMAACPGDGKTAAETRTEAPMLDQEGKAEFVFPLLESLLAFLFPEWGN